MSTYVMGLRELGRASFAAVGGKAASLGELCTIDGIQVPDGFCVTTAAYRALTENHLQLERSLAELAQLPASDRKRVGALSAQIRTVIENTEVPQEVAAEIAGCLEKFGHEQAFAVRSSATAEDLPTASFAGQHDTFLNIVGEQAIVAHIRKCWASLFTERAVVYRMQNGFDHRKVHLAVIVQKLISPRAAGISFTADPVTSNRKTLCIDASFGLGEAMVSGLVNADHYKVRGGEIIDKQISTKTLAVFASDAGGTTQRAIEPDWQNTQTLTDQQILQLERLGRKIERHFGQPQDIEWCSTDDTLYIVQSRPITTLFPIPKVIDDVNRVYVSVGHQQMMTDPFKPLGLSFRLLLSSANMHIAGGRLFVDVTSRLASPVSRQIVMNGLGKSDPLIKDALMTIVARDGFITPAAVSKVSGPGGSVQVTPQPELDLALVAKELIDDSQTAIAALKQTIQTKSGPELFTLILEDIARLSQSLFEPRTMRVLTSAMDAASWVNENMHAWLGEKNVADTLAQSVANNVTSEMGLALLDVADVIRPFPEVITYLQQTKTDQFLEELVRFEGGKETRDAICAYLDKYGMRCVGEIDITRPRWSEKPATLIPLLLTNIRNFAPGASRQRFDKGLREASNKERELLARLKQLPDGERKAADTQHKIALIRDLSGYREYPKYAIVSHYAAYKQALLKEAARLVEARVIEDIEDIYYLSFEELQRVALTLELDPQLVIDRKTDYAWYDKLSPPRVMTSDGEVVTGHYAREDLPDGAIAGLAVSSGIIEGRARVIFDIEAADIEAGDILVTPFTDPSWTPLFVSIAGLVTEVGGLMTHGAVIAREYGLPAIVGVQNATLLIEDGQRIRVNGTEGYVELLA